MLNWLWNKVKETTWENVLGLLLGLYYVVRKFLRTCWHFARQWVEAVRSFTDRDGDHIGWMRYAGYRWLVRITGYALTPLMLFVPPAGLLVFGIGIPVLIDQLGYPENTPAPQAIVIDAEGQNVCLPLDERGRGIRVLQAATHQMRVELDSIFGWTANDMVMPGTAYWSNVADNRDNRQRGVRWATAEFVRAYAQQASRYGSDDPMDPALLKALEADFTESADSWMIPPAEEKYFDGLANVDDYIRRLEAGDPDTRVNVTSRNVYELLRTINEDLLAEPLGRLRDRTRTVGYFELDDRVYYAQGAAIVARDALMALSGCFGDRLQDTGADKNLAEAIDALNSAAAFNPPFIFAGEGASILADARSKMANYLDLAGERITDVTEALYKR